jgi:hypothetical protein
MRQVIQVYFSSKKELELYEEIRMFSRENEISDSKGLVQLLLKLKSNREFLMILLEKVDKFELENQHLEKIINL